MSSTPLPTPATDWETRIRQLTPSPLQSEYTEILGASPEEVFAFISDFEALPEWMPGMNNVTVNNQQAETPGGLGAVRVITSYGKVTQEVVRAFEPPTWLAYSATNQSLGGMYTDHLGVLICEPEETDKTRFQGVPTRNRPTCLSCAGWEKMYLNL